MLSFCRVLITGIICIIYLVEIMPGWADIEQATRRQYLGNWIEAIGRKEGDSGLSDSAVGCVNPTLLGPHFWIDQWLAHAEIARSQEQPI